MDIVFVSTDGILSNQHHLEFISKRGINYMSIHQNQIDKEKVSLLNHLFVRSGALPVFTGTWKDQYSVSRLNEMLRKCGANWKAQDATPYLYKLDNNKFATPSDEIGMYLHRLYSKQITVNNFVILDHHLNNYDDYSSKVIKINYEKGLKPFHIEKALSVLGIEKKKKIVSN